MKDIGNQIKSLTSLKIPMILNKGLRTTVGIQFFMRLQKEQQIDNKQKIIYSIITCQKRLLSRKAIPSPQNMFAISLGEHR